MQGIQWPRYYGTEIYKNAVVHHAYPEMTYPEMTLHLLICIFKMAATQLSAFLYDLYRR
jgi:hypothetical protein